MEKESAPCIPQSRASCLSSLSSSRICTTCAKHLRQGCTFDTAPAKSPSHPLPTWHRCCAVAWLWPVDRQGPGLGCTLQRLSLPWVAWRGCEMPAHGAHLSGEKPPAPGTVKAEGKADTLSTKAQGEILPWVVGRILGRRWRWRRAEGEGQMPPSRRPGWKWQE